MEKETQITLMKLHLARWLTYECGLNLLETAIVLEKIEEGNGLGKSLMYLLNIKHSGEDNEEKVVDNWANPITP